MILGYYGKQGSGKTMLSVRYVVRYGHLYKKVYSNIHLSNTDFYSFDETFYDDLLSLKIRDSLILWDEIQEYINSRTFRDKFNMSTGTFIRQIRKANNTLVWNSQFIFQVDKVLRANTDLYIKCESNMEGLRMDEINIDKLKVFFRTFQLTSEGGLKLLSKKMLMKCRRWSIEYDTRETVQADIISKEQELKLFFNNFCIQLPVKYRDCFKSDVHADLKRFVKMFRTDVFSIMKIKKQK